jgi:myo-inositol-1(or 4)-monophosphatase
MTKDDLPADAPDRLSAILDTAAAQSLAFFNGMDARQVDLKSPGDRVSDADRAVEIALRDALGAAFPGDGILGEEYGGDPGNRYWAIDPIDGTSNFLSGLPFWTISLGLMVAGQPVLGGIIAPALGLAAVGGPGLGLRVTGLAAGSRPDLPICVGLGRNARWPSADRHALEARIEAAGLSPRLFGSCALSLLLVATGRLAGYIEDCVGGIWDCAGGLALCQAAGLPVAFRVHPDGTVDVVAGDILALAQAGGQSGEILDDS